MSEHQEINLGSVVRKARRKRGLSTAKLSELTGVSRATIVRIEAGAHRSPHPKALEKIALALGLPVSDLYALANYKPAESLPAFTPYLRTRYGDLPESALAELQADFDRIASRYGYDGDGPKNGEDET